MGRGLGRDVHTLCFRLPDRPYSIRRGDVLEVDVSTREIGEPSPMICRLS